MKRFSGIFPTFTIEQFDGFLIYLIHVGNFTDRPAVTIEHRPDGPVVVHNRRGTVEQIRRSRQTAVTVGAVGIILILVALQWLWMRERLDPTVVGNAYLIFWALILAVGYWYFVGRGWEEIKRSGSHLLVHGFPAWDGNIWVELARIDHVDVEEYSTNLTDKYRVQIVDLDGFGQLARPGPLSGIATQDEATALAAAMAAQFGLRYEPGVQDEPAASSRIDHFLPAKPSADKDCGKIRIEQSGRGIVIAWPAKHNEAIDLVIAGIAGFFAGFFLGAFLSAVIINPIINLILSVLFGCVVAAAVLARHVFYLSNGRLLHDWQFGPVSIHDEQIASADIEHVGMVAAWDSNDKMYFRVAAQMRTGEDIILISKLPKAGGHALVQALHQHLGLPIK